MAKLLHIQTSPRGNQRLSVIISTSPSVRFCSPATILEEPIAFSGTVANHYLIMFSPTGFEEFLKATSVPAPDDAVAPTEPPAVAVRNVFELPADYGIQFGN